MPSGGNLILLLGISRNLQGQYYAKLSTLCYLRKTRVKPTRDHLSRPKKISHDVMRPVRGTKFTNFGGGYPQSEVPLP